MINLLIETTLVSIIAISINISSTTGFAYELFAAVTNNKKHLRALDTTYQYPLSVEFVAPKRGG